ALGARRAQVLGQPVEQLAAAGHQDQRAHAAGGEEAGHGLADPARRAGDQRGAPRPGPLAGPHRLAQGSCWRSAARAHGSTTAVGAEVAGPRPPGWPAASSACTSSAAATIARPRTPATIVTTTATPARTRPASRPANSVVTR